jgi:translation initiation factor IF-1|tara:strand:+ start:74931 stop:75149 length:219 start_codon:yes stop_codon:yes gene_type:complete
VPSDSHVKLDGVVTDVHPGGQFGIELDTGLNVKAKLCGKMRTNKIRVLLGDRVQVSLSPYDLTHGIISFRYK